MNKTKDNKTSQADSLEYMNRVKIERIRQSDRERLQRVLGAPFEEIVRVAIENLRKVGCSEKGIDTVINDDDGLISAFENDFGAYEKRYFGTELEGLATDTLTGCWEFS